MYRAVLSVVLATALVAASIPAVETAGREHTAATVGSELRRVERAADGLLAADDAVPGAGARRVVTLRLPAESWTDAGVERVTVAPADSGRGAVTAWTVAGGRRHERRHPRLPLRTPGGEPVVIRSAGRHRLVLELDGTPADPAVTVRRFTSGDGGRRSHATLATRPGRSDVVGVCLCPRVRR